MTATINEILGSTAKGSQITSQAVEKAQEVSGKMDELTKASTEINKVTETIADISEQDNHLAGLGGMIRKHIQEPAFTRAFAACKARYTIPPPFQNHPL